MAILIFVAFIAVYALLMFAHRNRHEKGYRYFAFGLLISILYASAYYVYPHAYLIVILFLTSMAILTQYFHEKSISRKKISRPKPIVDIAKSGYGASKGAMGIRKRSRSRR